MPWGDIQRGENRMFGQLLKSPKGPYQKVYGYLPCPPSPVLPNSATITLATLPHFSLVHTIYLLKWEHDTQCRVPLSWGCAHITPTCTSMHLPNYSFSVIPLLESFTLFCPDVSPWPTDVSDLVSLSFLASATHSGAFSGAYTLTQHFHFY